MSAQNTSTKIIEQILLTCRVYLHESHVFSRERLNREISNFNRREEQARVFPSLEAGYVWHPHDLESADDNKSPYEQDVAALGEVVWPRSRHSDWKVRIRVHRRVDE